jgi:hypothetical protein
MSALTRRMSFARCRSGTALVLFGLLSPVLGLGVGAAVEYTLLTARRAEMQKAADGAAIAAAQQLRLSNSTDEVALNVARHVVETSLPRKGALIFTTEATVEDEQTAVAINIEEPTEGLFGRMFSLPDMKLMVASRAKLLGTKKLCLLTLDVSKGKVLNLDKNSWMTANGCGVYSNSTDKKGIAIAEAARLSAAQICSSGGADVKSSAKVNPGVSKDCPQISDPLASIPRPRVGPCVATDLKISASVIVSGTASLTGRNVGFFFTGSKGGMRLDPKTTISLSAPVSGEMTGILFFEDRSVTAPEAPPAGPKGDVPPPPYGSQPMRQYRITSNNAPVLLGTIYLPAGRLIIDASKAIAERSAYTVIVARQLELNSGPNLYLNSDYESSDVPVPQGVGSKSGAVALTR